VPEGARWIAHLDMEKFVATKLFEYLEKGGNFEIKGRDLKRWLQMEPKDVSSLTVFGLGPGDGQIVFAVAGKLDKAGIIALAEADKEHQKTPFGSYTLYSSGSDEYGAFVTDDLFVFSEGRAAIEKVLETAGGKTKNFTGSALSAALKEVPRALSSAASCPTSPASARRSSSPRSWRRRAACSSWPRRSRTRCSCASR